jgi:hypothetical protein
VLQRCGGNTACGCCAAEPEAGLQRSLLDDAVDLVSGAASTVVSTAGGVADAASGALGAVAGTVAEGAAGLVPGAAAASIPGVPGLAELIGEEDLNLLREIVDIAVVTMIFLRKGIDAVRRLIALVKRVGSAIVEVIATVLKCGWEALTLPFEALYGLYVYATSPAPESAIALRPFLDTVCACLPDSWVIGLVKHLYMHGEPLAVAHLQHYIDGSGADFGEDLPAFLSRDAGGRASIIAQINKAGTDAGASSAKGFGGLAFIGQGEYSLSEYRNAWGNVCCVPADSGDEEGFIRFEVLDSPADRASNVSSGGKARVQLQMRDHYKWHPLEERATKCLHEMLEKMKEQGAKEYFQVGAATVDLEIDPALIPL